MRMGGEADEGDEGDQPEVEFSHNNSVFLVSCCYLSLLVSEIGRGGIGDGEPRSRLGGVGPRSVGRSVRSRWGRWVRGPWGRWVRSRWNGWVRSLSGAKLRRFWGLCNYLKEKIFTPRKFRFPPPFVAFCHPAPFSRVSGVAYVFYLQVLQDYFTSQTAKGGITSTPVTRASMLVMPPFEVGLVYFLLPLKVKFSDAARVSLR